MQAIDVAEVYHALAALSTAIVIYLAGLQHIGAAIPCAKLNVQEVAVEAMKRGDRKYVYQAVQSDSLTAAVCTLTKADKWWLNCSRAMRNGCRICELLRRWWSNCLRKGSVLHCRQDNGLTSLVMNSQASHVGCAVAAVFRSV